MLTLFNSSYCNFASLCHMIGYDRMHENMQLYSPRVCVCVCVMVILELKGVCARIGGGFFLVGGGV